MNARAVRDRTGEDAVPSDLHRYAPMLYSHAVTTFRPVSDPSSLPPASGHARP